MQMKPTKVEMLNRISRHVAHRENNDACNLLWAGYLAACIEWGLLSPDDYHEVRKLLKPLGEDELREIFLGLDGLG